MAREDYLREIERLCDVQCAQENARLQEGGIGLDDRVDESQVISDHEGGRYLRLQEPQPIQLAVAEAPYRDEHRELIEARPDPRETTNFQEEIYRSPGVAPEVENGLKCFEPEIESRISDIRGRVMGYARPIREDIGFLLTVVDSLRPKAGPKNG